MSENKLEKIRKEEEKDSEVIKVFSNDYLSNWGKKKKFEISKKEKKRKKIIGLRMKEK